MTRLVKYFGLCLMIFVIPLNVGRGQSETPKAASFIELIANPTKFDGKVVIVTGFLALDPPDGNMIFLHKEDYDHGILLNALATEVSKQMWADREKLDQNYVNITGVFRSAEQSHNRFNTIAGIINCTFKSNPEDPIRGKLARPRKPQTK
jgi:hypothetical protein